MKGCIILSTLTYNPNQFGTHPSRLFILILSLCTLFDKNMTKITNKVAKN